MSRGRLIISNIIGVLVVLAIVAGGAYYYYQNQTFLKTDEAHVAGDMMQISTPAAGKITQWNVKEGQEVKVDQEVGKVSDGKTETPIKAAKAGTVVKNSVNQDQFVQAGQVLAQTIDMNNLYVTANIKETDLKDIENGNKVDITVDGDNNTTFEGNIDQIGYATTSVFSMMPQQNTSGNYTKVTQKVPVKISIKSPSDKVLPGMNAEISITK
ncbi:HlyD family efflux transporter periplasmic adaptor subunit [Metabacillus sp. GX 13764]|uniref:HlyD family efflux transporter periplasmic adaptor subunit n=1 Tax=Metabacillus kandeliae TaxID=2900151 RepID=UPI001E2849AB|nr:HlyD family efflux transporter periplasmic adaptor subunit [Metabacillus kandeliae]MCD7035803.1 HlyD family efflux transporter periplasmic adaptor subunit [Metabacillus kandeliae]